MKKVLIEMATDLIDFCGGELSSYAAIEFWKRREYNVDEFTKLSVFSLAYQLLKK